MHSQHFLPVFSWRTAPLQRITIRSAWLILPRASQNRNAAGKKKKICKTCANRWLLWLKELTAKLEDAEFVDSLSPKAEEEMRMKQQTLQEDMGRYQSQFYQLLQHAQYQMYQKMSGNIAKAAEIVAKEKNLSYVINKEACFYIRDDHDVTTAVIAAMDKAFEAAPKAKDLSEGDDLDLNALDEPFLDKAAG
jgi:Skp family chaperone for outer membrane proteins